MSLIFRFGGALFIPNNGGAGADNVAVLPTSATCLLLSFLSGNGASQKFSEPAVYFIALSDEVAKDGESVLNHLMRTSYVGKRVAKFEVRRVQECAR